jgi:hypothetical protein
VTNALARSFPQEDEYDDRRIGPRHISVLRVGRTVWNGRDQLCVVRNLSVGGLMFECLHPPVVGQRVTVELRSDKQMTGIVRWTKDVAAGVEFDQKVNVELMLREERSSLLRVRPRAPRFVRRGTARLISGDGEPVFGDIIDISIGGLSCRTDQPLRRGEPIVASIEGVGAANAELRWTKGDVAGIRFDKPLPWRAFQLWLDKAPRG